MDLASEGRNHTTVSLVQLLVNEAMGGALGADAAIDRLAYVVFSHILREQIGQGGLRGPLGALADPRLGPVLNLVHDRPGGPWSVSALARVAGMSRSAFAQRFKERVGMTVARYVTHWRMQEALELLRLSELSIAATAGATWSRATLDGAVICKVPLGRAPVPDTERFASSTTRSP